MNSRLIHVVDDFYLNPDEVRRNALRMPFRKNEDLRIWTTRPYKPEVLRELLEKKFAVRVKNWKPDPMIDCYNGAFYCAFATGRSAEPVRIHYDRPASWIAMVIYMTPNAPCDAGTSIWQHRQTGLMARPTRKDASRLGLSVQRLNEILIRDSARLDRWTEIDSIGNIYNRAVLFRGKLLHSASRHFGSNASNGRIYQGFQFPVGRA